MRLDTLIKHLQKFAPQHLAAAWDNVGLQTGNREQQVTNIGVTLTLTEEILHRATADGADLIITHHPLIFKPLISLAEHHPKQRLIATCVRKHIAVYAMHTNLDVVPGGVSDALAEVVGLRTDTLGIVSPTACERLFKIVVFVPEDHLESVRNALFRAGSGCIGKYAECSFSSVGTGTFKPLAGANPYIGKTNEREYASEVRLETIVREPDLDRSVQAMTAAHPYEEVAYDIIPLHQKGTRYGFGRYGQLSEPVSTENLAVRLGAEIKGFRQDREVSRLAVCGGNGSDLIEKLPELGVDTYVTGDIMYHTELLAQELGITVLDMGHYESEVPVLPKIERYIKTHYDNEVSVRCYIEEE